jgi:capsular polysaccharide biosynthesis protein
MTLVRDIREIGDHMAARRSPLLAFTQVAEAGRSPMRPPAFLLGPANHTVLWEIFGQIDTPGAGCYAIADGLVAPTGIAIKDGVAFHAEAFLQPRHHVVTVCDRLNAENPPVRHARGKLAVIYGPAHETWGHWLTDFLPRLWVLCQAGHDLATLSFLVPPDLRPFARTLLLLCGLREEQLVAYDYFAEIVRAELLLMPTGLRAGNRLAPCFAQATAFWTARARHDIATDQPRLYLSRAGAPQQRQMLNREAIESVARDAGFAVVQPETLPVAAQIKMFAGARVLAGEYGSGLHNSVFGGPGVTVCGLRGTSRHPSFLQSGIATALHQNAGYVFAATEGQDVDQRFNANIELFRYALEIMAVGEGRPGLCPGPVTPGRAAHDGAGGPRPHS